MKTQGLHYKLRQGINKSYNLWSLDIYNGPYQVYYTKLKEDIPFEHKCLCDTHK